jgi:hypothetical protein
MHQAKRNKPKHNGLRETKAEKVPKRAQFSTQLPAQEQNKAL